MISTPSSIGSVNGGVARKSCLFTKMPIWLAPIAEYVHFRQKSVFYEFDDKCVVFLHVLDRSPSIMIRKPWGTGSVNDDVARKSFLLPKMLILPRFYG